MLVNITLPYCLEKIEDGAFYGSQNIEHVDFDNTTAETEIQLTSIGISAFHGCESMVRFNETDGYKVYIPAKVTKLSTRAFYHCDAIESVYIPEQIGNEVGDYVFAESEKLATVSINNTKVGKYMFYNDSALDHVVVPDKVTSIGYAAFGGCIGLSTMELPFVGAAPYRTLKTIFTDGSKTEEERALAKKKTLFGYIFGELVPGYDKGSYEDALYTGFGLSSAQRYEEYTIAHQLSYDFYLPKNLKDVTFK